jgi:hypothetical protein
LAPEAIGDFVSGVAETLAFLWLVLGYFQQGTELRLQREQLALQKLELEKLANETKRQSSAVEANELHARRDTFLRIAEMIIEEQITLATRIVILMAGGVLLAEAPRWIGEGRRNVYFIQAWLCIKSEPEKYRAGVLKDADLSRAATRFISNFEYLVRQSDAADPKGQLRGFFEDSPMGTLYAGMSFLSGHQIDFLHREKPTGVDRL